MPNFSVPPIRNTIKNNLFIIVGIIAIIIIVLLVQLTQTLNQDFKNDLIDSELQRKAAMTAIAFKEGLLDEDKKIALDPELDRKLDSIVNELDEVVEASVAISHDNNFEVVASSSYNEIGTVSISDDLRIALQEQRVVSYKELKVFNQSGSELRDRTATIIVPIDIQDNSENEDLVEGMLIAKVSLNDVDQLTSIFLTNSSILSIFLMFVLVIVIGVSVVISNQMVKRNKKLRDEIETKDQLLSNAAHELGNPVSYIRGALNKVIKTENNLTSKGRELVERSITTADFLKEFIEDLLVVSRFERGKIEIYPRPMHLEEVIEKVCHRNIHAAEVKKLKLIYEQPKTPLPKIVADPDKISEIITNLVSNAIKYSYEGEIMIKTKYLEDDHQILVSIADNGIGMSTKDIEKLFNRFVRLSQTSQKEKGTGLGLYISKTLVELHEGKIWAESKLGEGSIFKFTLPVTKTK